MVLRTTLALAAAFISTDVVRADDADARTLKPFLTPQTAAAAVLDFSAAETADVVKKCLAASPNPALAKAVESAIEKLRAAGVRRVYLVISPAGLQPEDWAFVLASGPNAAVVRAAFPNVPGMTCEEKDGVVFFGTAAVWERLRQATARDDSLVERIERIRPNPFAAVARLPRDLQSTLAELSPQVPPALGGGSTVTLIEGFEALELTANLGEKPSVSIMLYGRSASAAARIAALTEKGLSIAARTPPNATPAEAAARALAVGLKPHVVENRVEMTVELSSGRAQRAVKGLLDAAEENARRQQIVNDLKQIVLAMHNSHDANKSFPPSASVDRIGKPLLSWRVHLLPYLDQNDLYKQFKLDEPWDSEHNRKLIDRMPEQYRGFAAATREGKTTILGFAGPGGLFPKPGEGVRMNDIKDGTSNTIMFVAAPSSQAVVWTKPDDLSMTDAALLSKVGDRDLIAAFCDGSVHILPKPATLTALIAYLTINGREVIEP